MLDILKAVILGIVQGLTEFLPVSSSGHLVVFGELLNTEKIFGDSGYFFELALHVGTLIPLAIVFFKDILNLFKPPFKKLGLLLLASVPALVVYILFNDYVVEFFNNSKYICFFFLITAGFLFITEFVCKKRERKVIDGEALPLKPVGLKTATIMGVAQAFALIPGISRSGSTICAGVLSGAERKDVATFSFFMSAIIIGGGAILECFKINEHLVAGAFPIFPVIFGMLAAAVSGYFALKFMLKLVQKSNYKWFSLYLVVVSVITFIDAFIVDFI